MGIFKRKIKNTFDIARETGIDEEKIKELKNGERHIEGETMEKVLNAINRDKVDRDMEKFKIFEWYKETDLKALRESFGYPTQSLLSKELKIDNAGLNRVENKKYDKLNSTIIKLYDFYHNDFNKRIEKPEVDEKVEEKEVKKIKKSTKLEEKRKEKEILDWYLNTDFKKLRGELTQYELAKKTRIPQSALCEIEKHKYKSLGKNTVKLYNYYNKENNEIDVRTPFDIVDRYDLSEIYNWYLSIDDLKEYRRKFGYSLNRMMAALNLSYDQMRDFESHKYQKATPVVCRFYEFYHNEENRLPEIQLDKLSNPNPKFKNSNNNIEVASTLEKEEQKVNTANTDYYQVLSGSNIINGSLTISNPLESEIEDLKNIIQEKDAKIEKLERQIMIYEKLIERL
jgi:DNA-binding XRE family transcriptional regulator